MPKFWFGGAERVVREVADADGHQARGGGVERETRFWRYRWVFHFKDMCFWGAAKLGHIELGGRGQAGAMRHGTQFAGWWQKQHPVCCRAGIAVTYCYQGIDIPRSPDGDRQGQVVPRFRLSLAFPPRSR